MADIKKINVGNTSYNIKDEEARNGLDALQLELTTKQDKIAQVTASVDSNVGTPSVTTTLVDGTLDFAFHNVKGEQGVKGDTVIMGDEEEYTLYNTTGSNTDGAMTQKAITDAITPLSESINGTFTDWEWNSGYVMHPGTPSQHYTYAEGQTSNPVAVSAGDEVVVTTSDGNDGQFCVIAYLATVDATSYYSLKYTSAVQNKVRTFSHVFGQSGYVVVSGLTNGMTAVIHRANKVVKYTELKAVEDKIDKIESNEKGIFDSWSWRSGTLMHPATPSTPRTVTGMQTSLPQAIQKGDKVVVETSDNGENTFTAIAYLATESQSSGWIKKAGKATADETLQTFTWTATSDGFVVVCGYTEGMVAYIEMANALAKKSDFDTVNKRLSDLEAASEGVFDDWVWHVGSLHPSNGKPSSKWVTERYSDLVTLDKGDEVFVRTYVNTVGSFCVIAHENSTIAWISESDRGKYIVKRYKASTDGEKIRVCVYVGDGTETYPTMDDYSAYIVKAKALVTKAELEKAIGNNTSLPEYWTTYLNGRMTSISPSSNEDAFLFVTDPHFAGNAKKSIGIVDYVTEKTSIAKTICGGDICSVGPAATGSTFEKMITQEIRALDNLAESAKKNGKFYIARGNHDYFEFNNSAIKYYYPTKYVVEHMYGLVEKLGTIKPDDANGLYYYFDNVEAKIRYIVIDCVHNSYNGYLQLGATQMQWIANTIASTQSGYGIVIVGHTPITSRFSESAEQSSDKFMLFRNMILAANNRSSGTISYTDHETTTAVDVNYDFTSLNANILMYLSGHSHIDNQAYHNGIPFVVCTCDKLGQQAHSPFCEGTPFAVSSKAVDTENEQAVSVLKISAQKDMISCIRLGMGYDRYYHIGSNQLSAGGTLDLTEAISKITPDSWHICDLDGVSYTNGAWPYSTNVATISEGIVTGVSAGEAMAFAEDENHNKEFFHIVVS